MEKIMNRQSQVQARPDLDRDGFLVISKASTLARYRELRKETTDVIGKYNLAIFFAFNDEQFRTGYRGLVSRGLISEGDKVCSCLGGGTAPVRRGTGTSRYSGNSIKRWPQSATPTRCTSKSTTTTSAALTGTEMRGLWRPCCEYTAWNGQWRLSLAGARTPAEP